ncbi:MAG: hypothetical protein RL518_1900 [Pseudomonadota bacterium]|jgi:pseudouridine synthase
MIEVRLQKFLAECGVGSRRKMEQFIKEGRVRVNGQVVTELGRKIDPSVDQVEVNRRPVRAAPKGVLLLNKPRGVVSTLSDPEGRRTVSEFVTKHYASYFPVGRLDWDSTGLIILTNDGEMAEKLMHPRYGFERTYEARVEGNVPQAALDKLRKGIRLSDGLVHAEAAIMSNDENSTWVEVKIKEGRNRVVRRMFEKIGHPVMKLKRTVYGPFKIGRLQVGQVRVLTAREYLQVRRKVMTFKGEESVSAEREPKIKQERRPEGRLSDWERERPRLKPSRDEDGGRSSPRQRRSEDRRSRSSEGESERPSTRRSGGRGGDRRGGERPQGERSRTGARTRTGDSSRSGRVKASRRKSRSR